MASLYEYHSRIGIATPFRYATLNIRVEDETLLVEKSLRVSNGLWVYTVDIDEPADVELANIALDMLDEDRVHEYMRCTREICDAIGVGEFPTPRPVTIPDRLQQSHGLRDRWRRLVDPAVCQVWYTDIRFDGHTYTGTQEGTVRNATSLASHRLINCNEIAATFGSSQPRLLVLAARAYLNVELDNDLNQTVLAGTNADFQRHRR